jgi:hypothetical protein
VWRALVEVAVGVDLAEINANGGLHAGRGHLQHPGCGVQALLQWGHAPDALRMRPTLVSTCPPMSTRITTALTATSYGILLLSAVHEATVLLIQVSDATGCSREQAHADMGVKIAFAGGARTWKYSMSLQERLPSEPWYVTRPPLFSSSRSSKA